MIVYDIALRVPFRGLTRRQGVLFEGPAGWAEWSPFPEYGDEEAGSWLAAAVEAAEQGSPEPIRQRVPVNGIVPAIPPGLVAARVRESGCATIKVKVAAPGESLDDDIARVAAVRQALPEGRIRIDANGGWDLATAETALRELAPLGLEYAEQPCRDVAELAELRRRLDGMVAIAADESIRRADDPLRVRDLGAADVVVLKQQPLGGARACLRLVEQLGLPAVVSSAVETSVGLHAGLRLAAALPELPFACGLETANLLAGDVVSHPLTPVSGELLLHPLIPDPALLAAHRADEATAAWWQERLRRVAAAQGVSLP